MRIGLDVRWIDSSGIGTTIRGLLDYLTSAQLGQMVLYGVPGWKNPYPCEFREVPEAVYGIRQHMSYASRLNKDVMDLFHVPHFDVPYFYKGPFISTVHDLIHFKFPEYSTKPLTKLYSGLMLRHVSKCAQRIIVVSQQTKRDLIQFFPEAELKITVLNPAVDKSFSPVAQNELEKIINRYSLKKGYALYVGNLRASKNTPFLIRAYSHLLKNNPLLPPLVLAGKNSLPPQEIPHLPQNVRLLGSVPQGDLPALYSGASVFVFPSLYEGFGIPPLEAMACGTPVIASRVASIPEVCGEAALYFDPHSEKGLEDVLLELIGNESLKISLRQKGFDQVKRFSWAVWARETWKIYEEVVEAGRS
ncbi:MAG: D-inositol-3-phosphate glycosyltransferase [Elusimicrobia bacterium]|nr:D-inositol-3-phosphate glycosyltransferase [Elusimicrobiota bacterium]